MRKVTTTLLALAFVLSGCTDRKTGSKSTRLQAEEHTGQTVNQGALDAVEPEQPAESNLAAARTPDVVFVPTPQEVVDKMLEIAEVEKGDVLYDLGCGDGRIVVTAAARYGCRAVGYDIDPQRIKESLLNVKENNVGHLVKIEQKDIFTLDLSEASVITLYLLPRLNVRLIPQLEKLRPGSRIVSHDFRMKGVQPDKVVRMTCGDDERSHKIYFWTTPLNRTSEKPAAGGNR